METGEKRRLDCKALHIMGSMDGDVKRQKSCLVPYAISDDSSSDENEDNDDYKTRNDESDNYSPNVFDYAHGYVDPKQLLPTPPPLQYVSEFRMNRILFTSGIRPQYSNHTSKMCFYDPRGHCTSRLNMTQSPKCPKYTNRRPLFYSPPQNYQNETTDIDEEQEMIPRWINSENDPRRIAASSELRRILIEKIRQRARHHFTNGGQYEVKVRTVSESSSSSGILPRLQLSSKSSDSTSDSDISPSPRSQ